MNELLILAAGIAIGILWSAYRCHGSMADNLRRIVPLGGGGPDPTDPRR